MLMIEPGEHPSWWVDSSYSIHPGMQSHSGVCMTLGKGVAYSVSSKQKLNTKSSTEAELIAIDNVMGQVLWTCHFLAEQGQYVPMTTIYQDNKSRILLAENGRTSSSKSTRHLNVRYYFITDQIKKGYVKVAFCPIADMLADFFMKPLQGMPFICMRDQILNLPTRKHTNVHRSLLGGPKNDKSWEHANHGDDMRIGTAVGSKDLSSGFNKNKYKIGKMTAASGNKWEKLLSADPSS